MPKKSVKKSGSRAKPGKAKPAKTSRRIDKGVLISIIAFSIIILDQLSKYLVENVFHLKTVHNTGAAFGILQGMNASFVWFYIIVIGVLLFSYNSYPKSTFFYVMIGLLFGAIIGNMADRLIHGYVIDFIHSSFWPSFNIADSATVASILGLIYYYWRKE